MCIALCNERYPLNVIYQNPFYWQIMTTVNMKQLRSTTTTICDPPCFYMVPPFRFALNIVRIDGKTIHSAAAKQFSSHGEDEEEIFESIKTLYRFGLHCALIEVPLEKFPIFFRFS